MQPVSATGEDAWQATPPEVRRFVTLLVTKLAALEMRLNQTSQPSSSPPSFDPPSTEPGSLATAITNRANAVVDFADEAHTLPRSPEEQQAILGIFLDVVQVAPDDPRCAVRQRRTLAALTAERPERRRLIDQLVQAGLLSAATEASDPPVETIDIVHEALIANWQRLRDAIAIERERLRRRSRFEQRLRDWEADERSDTRLLTGVDLAEAEELYQLPLMMPHCLKRF